MKDIKKKNDGFISLFVLIAMLFLLIFIFGVYSTIKNKKSIQYEKDLKLKQVYSKNIEDIENNLYANSKEIIPINNIKELELVGSSKSADINHKIYKCDRGSSYNLKNNIIVDIEEDLMKSKVKFNDYKLYSDTFYMDKAGYDCYYYYKKIPNQYWKVIAYQNFDKNNSMIVNEDVSLEKKFRILKKIDCQNKNIEFMMIWTDKENNLSNIDIEKQYFDYKLLDLEQINIFRKNINSVDKDKGSYYLLINIGKIK